MSEHINPAHLPTPPAAGERAYRVDWAIDIPATSPVEAAAFALEIQRQDSLATVFSVTDAETNEVTIHDMAFDGAIGTNRAARRPEDSAFVPRTLRPGVPLQSRSGYPAEILSWEEGGDLPLYVRITLPDGGRITGLRSKTGRRWDDRDDEYDVLEANPTITRWVRLYDRKLNAAGKQVVGGKEFAAERGLFMYVFPTREEAVASLQGVRAVFPITYHEGEGLG